ncbi:IS66 family transposase [Alkalibacter mobilis]|jgi:transposase|uniref:IS66 family transposase n=1 Tax=Alkalibacter mobilis TaxID=2787712 RepID=UPI0018A0ECE3|nr:IS66 family transposase [Alkalibacter mobilis]MBF7096297.1 IS66 family transposase [Alkalibacter mobilis]
MTTTTNESAFLDIIKQQSETIAALQKSLDQMNEESKLLREQIDYLTKKLFGRKSEKTDVISGQIVLDEVVFGQFDEAEVSAIPDEVETLITKKKSRKGYSREKAMAGVVEEDRFYSLREEDRTCEIDGDHLHYMGRKYVRTEIEYHPATMKLVHLYHESRECRTCRKQGRPHIRTVHGPAPVLQHSMASASSVAWTMYQKYVNHVPLYRQEKDWQNLGLELKRSTLANWIIKTSGDWLAPMVDRLREKLLEQNYLHADETTLQVLKEEGRQAQTKSYMWVFATGETSQSPVRIFRYHAGRSGNHAANFLSGYTGYLHTDGYSGYGKVQGITRCTCWSHVRRYFMDALPKDSKTPESTFPKIGIAYCNKLFEIESKLKELSAKDRKDKRLELELPVLEAFWTWVDETLPKALAKSRIGKALQYANNHKKWLMTFLEDGNCAISNNLAENSIRPFTVGRKNWLFSSSPAGADASATVYSIVETAKANGLNPYKYLEHLLTEIPSMDIQKNLESLDDLLPWNSSIQAACAVKK